MKMTTQIRTLMMEDAWAGRVEMTRRRPKKLVKGERNNSVFPEEEEDGEEERVKEERTNVRFVHNLQERWNDTRLQFVRIEMNAGLATLVADNFFQLVLQLFHIGGVQRRQDRNDIAYCCGS